MGPRAISFMSEYLFAYGTLRPGFAPASIAPVVDRLEPVGEGFLWGVLYDLGEYPGLVLESQAVHRALGTVFRLPDEPDFLTIFDDYEGFEPDCPEASLFVRLEAAVEMLDGGQMNCWVYVYSGPTPGVPIISHWRT
jgi:gamma-glutamylcyclotransferase (GGCT)/AIG2-like uncharacterized protein YtfP